MSLHSSPKVRILRESYMFELEFEFEFDLDFQKKKNNLSSKGLVSSNKVYSPDTSVKIFV